MNHKTKYPPGSPKDILIRLRRTEREIKQQLTDIQSVNDNNPNFKDAPLDVGRYLVQLKKIRAVIAEVRAVIVAGRETLPEGILNPILDPW